MMSTLRYLRGRLNERSTYLLIVGAIGTAALLPWPWSLASCIVGAIAAFVPDGPVKKDGEP